jgi:fatty-acyl-CoA synthase
MSSAHHRLDDLLDAFRSGPAGRPAFVEEDGREFTVAEFDMLVAKAAAWLTDNGIGRGDRVAVWLVNRIEWLALLFALARIGAVLVAVNTRYRAAELRHILVSSGARMLIMQPGFRRIDFAAAVSGLVPSELTELETVAVLGEPGEGVGRILDRPTIAFDLDAAAASASPPGPDAASDPSAALILFTTSGTTKSPKLVMHPQRTIALHALRSAKAGGFDRSGSAFLTAMPFCGVFGLNTVLAAIAGGAVIHLISTFYAADAAQRVEKNEVTHLFGSDEMFRRLIDNGMEKLASARLCGFASFTPGLGEILKSAIERGLPLAGLYGSSEVNAIFAIQPLGLPAEERLRGGGRPASGSEAEIRIRDKETGRLLGALEPGEIEIRAPTNFTGYFRNPEATGQAIDADGFFRTGDIGYLRDDGTFVYVARSGDAIRLSGFLVDPAEIEDVLKTIEGVRDAQVVGVETGGQTRAAAFVIPKDQAVAFDEAALIGAAAAKLAAFKVPVRVFPVDAFPTTESANGLKIQRAKLRQMAAERLGRS